MAVTDYSRTPASNNSAPPNGAPEGWAPSAVNNTIRQIMTDIVNEAAKNQAKVLASVAGTDTITATMTPDLDAYSAGMTVVFTPANNNTGATTLNIDSLGALDILKADGDALASGDLVAGVPAMLVLDSGADDWILLNPQSLTLTNGSFSGTLSVTGAVTLNGALTTDNSSSDEAGFKGLPQNSQTANYTAVLSDAGKHIKMNNTSLTFTIPANASVAYPIGTVLTVVNRHSTSLTIAITSDTMILAADGSTGSRTLVSNGISSILKTNTTEWVISGAGVT
jgi:hypothetical protein